MRNTVFVITASLGLFAGPALATGLQIELAGEAEGTVTIDLYEEIAPGHVDRDHHAGRGGCL